MLATRPPRRLLALAATLASVTLGCAGFGGRATAPDERGEAPRAALTRPRDPFGPAVVVHVASYYEATLVRLDERDEIADACPAPCDRRLPLDATYRIDGPRLRSTWPFHLVGEPEERVVVTVSPSMRSSYATAKTLGAVGGILEVVGLAGVLGAAIVATDRHDADNGSPAPCPGCRAASIGGAVTLVAGMGVSLAAIILGIQEMNSGVSQRTDVPPPGSTRTLSNR